MWHEVCELFNPDEIINKQIENESKCLLKKVLFRIPLTWYFVVKVERFNMTKLMIATKEFDYSSGKYYFELI